MVISVKRDNGSGLNAVVINGLEKNRKSEEIATSIVREMIKNEMLSPYTLNNWKNGSLVIRYATDKAELDMLFNAIKSDITSPTSHNERSLLY